MQDFQLESFQEITSQTMNLKKLEFKQLEEKYIELKHLQKLQLIQVKKIYMFKDLLEYFQEDFQFLKLSEILKLRDLNMEEIRMLLYAIPI
jgi:hypothetical protein